MAHIYHIHKQVCVCVCVCVWGGGGWGGGGGGGGVGGVGVGGGYNYAWGILVSLNIYIWEENDIQSPSANRNFYRMAVVFLGSNFICVAMGTAVGIGHYFSVPHVTTVRSVNIHQAHGDTGRKSTVRVSFQYEDRLSGCKEYKNKTNWCPSNLYTFHVASLFWNGSHTEELQISFSSWVQNFWLVLEI